MSDKHINPLASDRELAIMIPGNKFAESLRPARKPQTMFVQSEVLFDNKR